MFRKTLPHDHRLLGALCISIVGHALVIVLVFNPFHMRLQFGMAVEPSAKVFNARIVDSHGTEPIIEGDSSSFQPDVLEGPLAKNERFAGQKTAESASRRIVNPVRHAEPKEPSAPNGNPVESGMTGDGERKGLPPAPDYMASSKLDQAPFPLHDIEPEYPETVGMQEGNVVLRILINEEGLVDNAAVVRAFPPEIFDEAAISAFGKAQFSPGKFLGVAVKSQIVIEIQFTPLNRGGAVSGRSY